MIRRLLISIPVLFGISLIAFFIVRLVPGDTVTAMLGSNYNEEQAIMLREQYGLDKSILTQYALWIANVLTGDLGYSYFTNKPVLDVILKRLQVKIEIAFI